MMRNRLISLFLALLMLLPPYALAAGESEELWKHLEGDGGYVTVRLPYPEGKELNWRDQRYLSVRYADTKEPVALSSEYQQGYLFATVPAQDAERPLEVYQGVPVEFKDCFRTWGTEEKQERLYDPPFGTEYLNIRGLFLGDDVGNLNSTQFITRAEAFAIISRLLSLDAAGEPDFLDVAEGDWFYETASAVKAAGLTNEPMYFRPNDPVTRGEFTVMFARALKMIGWIDRKEGLGAAYDLVLTDRDEIPEWAYDAYCELDAYNIGIVTYRDTDVREWDGVYVQEKLAQHSKGATRAEVIELVYDTLRWVPVYPTQLAIEWGFDKEMPIADGSTSTYPYTQAVYGALFTNYSKHPDYPAKHSKSFYSYERLINGEADLLFIASKPTQETLDRAVKAGVELEFIPIAYDAMVFFTNPENTVTGLTSQQIKEIYVENAHEKWSGVGGPDANLVPYCRNPDSGSQALMEQFFLDGGDIHPDIRQETTSRSMESILTDVYTAKADEPLTYGLGYSIYNYYEMALMLLMGPDGLKLLEVDGVLPTAQTIKDKSYSLAGYNYIAIRADQPEDSLARRIVEFMLSPAGQQCVSNAGFSPLG